MRFIYLTGEDDGTDGIPENFKPTEKYYQKIDEVIQNKKQYLIIREHFIKNNQIADKRNNEKLRKRYLNKKMNCRKIETECLGATFFICDFINKSWAYVYMVF